jgi:hypothetical protein
MVIEPTPMMGKVSRLDAGIELIGEYQGSVFQQPRYLVRRADGQVLQLSRLLYLLTAAMDGQRNRGLFTPMFWSPVILAMLAGFVGLDVLIIAQGGLGHAATAALGPGRWASVSIPYGRRCIAP